MHPPCPLPSVAAAHTFPKEAYEILLYIARAYLSSVMSLLYPLQSGRLALRCAALRVLCRGCARDCVGQVRCIHVCAAPAHAIRAIIF